MSRGALHNIHLSLSSFTASLTSSAAPAKHCPACKRPWRREFSSTPSRYMTRLRSEMFTWLNTRGKNFEHPVKEDTNYLTDYDRQGFRVEEREVFRGSGGGGRSESVGGPANGSERGRSTPPRPRQPFPLNGHFISRPILSEQLREEIWTRVKVDKKSIRIVSVELGVEMRRIGAVVRLMEVEKQWRAEVSRHPLPVHLLSYSRDEQPNID